MYFLLCNEDLAKGGRFWINMFARKIPMMVIRQTTLSSFLAVHIRARVDSVYFSQILVVLRSRR